jgi:hypothetical protein
MKEKRLIIDVNTLPDLTIGGKRITVAELFQLYRNGGPFLYDGSKGNAPIPIDDDTEIRFVDIKTLSEEEIEKIYNDKIRTSHRKR